MSFSPENGFHSEKDAKIDDSTPDSTTPDSTTPDSTTPDAEAKKKVSVNVELLIAHKLSCLIKCPMPITQHPGPVLHSAGPWAHAEVCPSFSLSVRGSVRLSVCNAFFSDKPNMSENELEG